MVAKLSTRRYSLRQINNFLCYFCNHLLHYDLHKTVMKLLLIILTIRMIILKVKKFFVFNDYWSLTVVH